ncbi:hypothetical protein ISG33_16475 [Glaciecola sp. MH2013]|uniref:hypothetical protein n=1 Tax=Glaciecola sp. MH2013 TaxID=2785524 RepID=UPI0018A0697D|nr:hypothetical protein [Glaciecola sp. MH2013]MBF7074998.1 hypothetical protein [Glaciecola sp. MH2013]
MILKHLFRKTIICCFLVCMPFIARANVTITPMQVISHLNNAPNHTVAWKAYGATSCNSGSYSFSFFGGNEMSPFRIDGYNANGSKVSTAYAYGRSLDVYINTNVSSDTQYTYRVYAYTCNSFGGGSYIFAGSALITISASGTSGGNGSGEDDDSGNFTNGLPPANLTFVHTDLLGSPVAETDENGDKK